MEVGGAKVEILQISTQFVNVMRNLAIKVVPWKVKVLQLGAVVEGCGEATRDEVEAEVKVCEVGEATDEGWYCSVDVGLGESEGSDWVCGAYDLWPWTVRGGSWSPVGEEWSVLQVLLYVKQNCMFLIIQRLWACVTKQEEQEKKNATWKFLTWLSYWHCHLVCAEREREGNFLGLQCKYVNVLQSAKRGEGWFWSALLWWTLNVYTEKSKMVGLLWDNSHVTVPYGLFLQFFCHIIIFWILIRNNLRI